MIKLLLTINNLNTAGMKFVLADIVKYIDRSKFEPMIGVSNLTDSALEREMKQICPVMKLPIRIKKKPFFTFPWRLWKASRKLKGIADVAHSFDYSTDFSEAWAMKWAGVRFVAEKTNLIYDEKRWSKKLGKADHIVCLSQAQLQQLSKYRDKVTCIPTGIDLKRFDDAKPAKRNDFGLAEDDFVFISIAHLVDVKGYVELMDALVPVVADYPNLKILAVGEGTPEFEAKLKKKRKALDLENNMIFLGRNDNVPALLKMSDVKILATQNRGRREGFGAAIVEAMACGLPVLATRSGGPEDIVLDGKTGWLVSGDGPKSLEEGLRKALAEKNKWKEYGPAGYARAKEAYNVPLMVKQYEEVYSLVGR